MTWSPPGQGNLKINCDGDGTFNTGGQKASMGNIIRNHLGKVVDGRAKSIPGISSLYSEAAAVSEACIMAVTLQFKNAIIENDNAFIITYGAIEEAPPWEVYVFVNSHSHP
ncbi:unnamed protein product [Ilex paraguariensis]|uniref:RNase H type-1 domain-containing protein n=1 Tax=Ilex paraguariensis TaxID=185542 RepID=A0ABC8UX63_9AQUA